MPRAAIQQPDKTCLVCGKPFNRNHYNGILEDNKRFRARKYCSMKCMAKAKMKADPTRDAYRKRAKHLRMGKCDHCGTTDKLSMHHKDLDWRNNDPENIQTLCSRCHLLLHHRLCKGGRLRIVRPN